MRKIVQKNEVSIMKLSARRGLECRILHHLSFACYFSIFSCYFKIYWHPWQQYQLPSTRGDNLEWDIVESFLWTNDL